MTLIPSQRHRFAMSADIHYLNCAYMSPLAHSVAAAIAAGAQTKSAPWTYRPADFFTVCEDFRARAAAVMAVDTDHIAIVPSASYGLAIAAKNLPMTKGQDIVILAEQFPSNVYIWREHAAAAGGKVVSVQRDPDAAWTDAVLDAIGDTSAIVAVPHCHWADGRIVDLAAVAAKCRHFGAALVLDLTQSLGAMPIDFAAVRPDFAVAANYKWLMGPYGTAMLYVDPQYHGGTPIEENWINRAGAEDFARLVEYRDDYQPGARRFDMGEKANPPLLQGAGAGLDLLSEWGIAAIAETLAAHSSTIAAAAARLGLTSAPIGVRAPHFLSLSFPGGVPADLTERLAKANVFVSLRGASLRVTPHVYNEPGDWERLIAVLAG